MNVDSHTLLIIVCVAATTYATRLLGFYLLRNRTLSVRQQRVLEVMPGCVLISVIAPYFVPNNLADALAITVAVLAASRLSLLPAVCVSVVGASLLRYWLA